MISQPAGLSISLALGDLAAVFERRRGEEVLAVAGDELRREAFAPQELDEAQPGLLQLGLLQLTVGLASVHRVFQNFDVYDEAAKALISILGIRAAAIYPYVQRRKPFASARLENDANRARRWTGRGGCTPPATSRRAVAAPGRRSGWRSSPLALAGCSSGDTNTQARSSLLSGTRGGSIAAGQLAPAARLARRFAYRLRPQHLPAATRLGCRAPPPPFAATSRRRRRGCRPLGAAFTLVPSP